MKHQPNIDDIEEIRIETGPVAFTSAGIKEPKIGVEGKFSLWFLAALSIAEGHVNLEKFTDQKVNNPRLIDLRRKVKATLVRELKFGARVEVKMTDGTQYQGFRETPKGDPANPLSLEEIERKYQGMAKKFITEKDNERLLRKIKNIESLNDVRELTALLP
ncbi:MAG: MmgE/PrpD family protein [Deltaproteobacteria bacterium]|nr:MmgE/PrpD family protein [Deltaproteobacteria bacterium]